MTVSKKHVDEALSFEVVPDAVGMAMIAMTTSNSINVKARRKRMSLRLVDRINKMDSSKLIAD